MTLDRAAVSAAVRALDVEALARRRWYGSSGEVPTSPALAHAFALAPDVALAVVDIRVGERLERCAIPFVERDGTVREAADGDGAWRALADAIAAGRTIGAMPRAPRIPGTAGGAGGASASGAGSVDAALVCRPSPALADLWPADAGAVVDAPERPLGLDQSNTSTVLGERLLLKAYRRLQPGLNPDLELTAYLTEEAGFPGVARLAGWCEVVSRDTGATTVAMLEAYIASAEDAYAATEAQLAELVGAPGSVSLEWATEIAADLGTLIAGLHAALATPPADAPDLAPRLATHDELHAWRIDAYRHLNSAIAALGAFDPSAAAELREDAAAIAARASRFEAVASAPLVMRIHGALHLGEVLVGEDGYRVIDFEGDPRRSIEERRRPESPLRDVASMLRSLDHVARSAGRRAERLAGAPVERPGLDIEAWIERARARFLSAYAEGLRASAVPITLDLDLLDAFEVAREIDGLERAATDVPSELWVPRAGLRWLLAHGADG